MLPIVLASASPRRRALLEQVGLDFEVFPTDVDETVQWEEPVWAVQELACRKARAAAQASVKKDPIRDAWIIGADTVVVHRGKVLGKPADRQAAVDMLSALQGETHSVYTGVCAVRKQGTALRETAFTEETKVSVHEMEMWEIEEYADTLEPMDKAGAYAIQGIFARYIRCIEGDYCNVVGLPVARIFQQILKNG